MKKAFSSAAVLFALTLVLAACGGNDEPTGSAAPPATTAAPAATGGTTIAVATVPAGDVLVDGEGRTLYMFKPDTDGTSTCYDECETNWPPLTVSGDITVGEGLDASLFTTTDRTDGSTQVKAGAWPLYYFANDAAPGDTNGQDVGDVWYVVSPTGEPIES
jgi:predicted lipoprotein with Yx(FWY)xxD motif